MTYFKGSTHLFPQVASAESPEEEPLEISVCIISETQAIVSPCFLLAGLNIKAFEPPAHRASASQV